MAFKIYTKTGDKGQTALFGGTKVLKNHIRVETYGTVDELNAYIGLLRDLIDTPQYKAVLKDIQDLLFSIGATLATESPKKMIISNIKLSDVQFLENQIDTMETTLEPLKNFILSGGHQTVSFCNVARTVCRRAERMVVALNAIHAVEPLTLIYLNRLSDYLFVLGRKVAKDLNVEEIIWNARI